MRNSPVINRSGGISPKGTHLEAQFMMKGNPGISSFLSNITTMTFNSKGHMR